MVSVVHRSPQLLNRKDAEHGDEREKKRVLHQILPIVLAQAPPDELMHACSLSRPLIGAA
jgi:hypothetical protein